ncbi:MAG TPA: GNAT family protein [Gaiellaceae bacterium]|nr:GNAT family protein [Gaiellaceae bacterium]
MTAREPPLASFAIPDRFEIDGPLIARLVTEADVPTIAPAFRDPDIGGENGMPPFDEPALLTIFRERMPELRAQGLLVPYVIEDTADGTVLGGITLRHFDPMRHVIEVGYWLFADARGRGIATRAVRAVTREAFASGLWRVEACVRVGNDASDRVLERAGFSREGLKRRYLRHGGARVDATIYSRLADE